MSAGQLSEAGRNLILSHIKTNIATFLDAVRTDRNDNVVGMEYPASYFIYDGARIFQTPAVFVVIDSIEFPEEATGANHVNAKTRMFVSVVIEDQDADKLTVKSERYQAALFDLLHWQTLVDGTKNLKVFVRVLRAAYSPLYTKDGIGDVPNQFRKEVSLELEVKHFENPTS